MPFLFPALASAVCDIGILYLGHRNYLREHSADESLSKIYALYDDDSSRRLYHYGYIVMLAAIRLFLLLVPLPYHSFFGKALRCPIVYRLFYGVTIAVVVLHALTLALIDPSSLSSLLTALAAYSNDETADPGTMHHILVTRSLWVALILTLTSTLNHIALFFHVRSTAPRESELFGGRRRPKVLLYYAKEKKQQLDVGPRGDGLSLHGKESTEREGLLSGSYGNGTDATADDDNSSTIGLPIGGGAEDNHINRNRLHSDSGRAFKEISNKLMMEIQVRLLKAKQDWTKRLDDYQEKLRTAAAASSSSSTLNSDHNLHHHLSLHNNNSNNVSPFRVILELFAGDNNFNRTNNDHGGIIRLDAAYDRDDGAALMLFVPQLLSFLLHGAYESSQQLEEWVLETCRKNLFFAHKCYWFLRAWSLETTSVSIDRSWGGDRGAQLLSPQQQVTRLSHSSSLTSFATQEDDPGSKLLPEERAVIEELMRKIMKCGEQPARVLHFGSTMGRLRPESSSSTDTETLASIFPFDSISNRYSSSSLTSSGAARSGLIPVNPLTGVPSRRHFDCLVAQRRHGFLPLDDGAELSATYNQSILNGHPSGPSYFDSCPVFMDALITIADNLFKVPRHLRRAEFRKQLDLLEVEALPCNEIYIPLQDLHHRVWRIVAEESIPLSTKERVPCIVCLEVLTYTPEQQQQQQAGGGGDRDIGNLFQLRLSKSSAAVSERETVEAWRNSRRNPYRRESTFNRVTQGMGKLPDKMKESMQEMQEQIRHSIEHMRERADSAEYWPAFQNIPGPSEYDCLNIPRSHPGSPKQQQQQLDPEDGGGGGDEFFDALEEGSSTPPKRSRPPSPKTPRSSIRTGAMGQWTKSPAPPSMSTRNSAAAAAGGRGPSPSSRILRLSKSEADDLAPPAFDGTRQLSFWAADSAAGGGSTVTRRRASKQIGFSSSSVGRTLEVDIERSSFGSDDDENDFGDGPNRNGAVGGVGAPASLSGASRPPGVPAKPPPVVFKENWKEKEDRLRSASAYGNHPGWRLLPVLVKSNDDLRQEQLASQLIQRMALILARDSVPVWLCPYEILALDASGGIIEAIPDTISLASLKKNDPDYTDLRTFFGQYFDEADLLADAKANFCESLAAYSMVCFLLQIKDRHNGNILLDNRGHLIHIDFGFFFLSSPGKNTGFESAPFKLTREFVDVLGGPDSHHFGVFRTLCYRTFLSLRKSCHEIVLLVEMLRLGNENLACFLGRPDDAIRELRERFRLDLNDRACLEYVNALIDESLENWRTNWYDRYQRYCVGVL